MGIWFYGPTLYKVRGRYSTDWTYQLSQTAWLPHEVDDDKLRLLPK